VGGFGYVLKLRVGEDLAPAIRAALRGELLISPFPAWREGIIEGTDDVDLATRSGHQQEQA
jgi:hypothetical protein